MITTLVHFILSTVGPGELLQAAWMGLFTLMRVTILLLLATLIWTPIGVMIGFQPQLARLLQPIVQFLASFPANFIFPFATMLFLQAHVPIGWGSILL
ncbi:MAG: sulfonate ABC transporter permease, partial [bacterium]